ncbi:nuclear transport factor 2 family protein [Streptomyces sp. NPDC050388]|uniref:nuclear transport factor 2 family protein n=1 Tax=Streptomyces sp. NPDC050388 TaxID=3155781 RepID=UPI003430C1F8
MTIRTSRLGDPAVRAFVTPVDDHDQEGSTALLAPGATMADDGSDRDPADWVDREVFSSHGPMDVDDGSDGGRSLLVRYRNDTRGETRTRWSLTADDDGISRSATGRA